MKADEVGPTVEQGGAVTRPCSSLGVCVGASVMQGGTVAVPCDRGIVSTAETGGTTGSSATITMVRSSLASPQGPLHSWGPYHDAMIN